VKLLCIGLYLEVGGGAVLLYIRALVVVRNSLSEMVLSFKIGFNVIIRSGCVEDVCVLWFSGDGRFPKSNGTCCVEKGLILLLRRRLAYFICYMLDMVR